MVMVRVWTPFWKQAVVLLCRDSPHVFAIAMMHSNVVSLQKFTILLQMNYNVDNTE